MAKKKEIKKFPSTLNLLIIVGLAIILLLRLNQLINFLRGIGNQQIDQSILLFAILFSLPFIAITIVFLIFTIKRKIWAYWGTISLAVLQFGLMDFSNFTPLAILMTCLNVILTFGPLLIIYSYFTKIAKR